MFNFNPVNDSVETAHRPVSSALQCVTRSFSCFQLLSWCFVFSLVGWSLSGSAKGLELETQPDGIDEAAERRDILFFVSQPRRIGQSDAPSLEKDKVEWLSIQDQPENAIELDESIAAYTKSVDLIENDGGAWNPELVENLAALAGLTQKQGRHDEAVKLFNRAIHVTRIGVGLHALNQIQLLEGLIASEQALENWEAVDNKYDYLLYLQERAYGRNDSRLIPLFESLGDWNIKAFNLGFGESRGLALRKAQLFYSAAAQLLYIHFGKKDERFIPYLKNVVHAAYSASQNGEAMTELGIPEFRNINVRLSKRLQPPPSDMVPSGFLNGVGALGEIINAKIEINADNYDIAESFAQLADWYVIMGRRDAAEMYYNRAWLLVSGEGMQVSRDRLFGGVVPIPTFFEKVSFGRERIEVREELNSDFVDLSFDVTVGGTVRNVRVVSEETEENAAQHNRIKRLARRSLFRPLLVDGIPQYATGNLFRYRYWY
ncbi:tetratricopeptide repeat protein [OM182 bacterium]|nr:tetratricopeptide repeat protein [OM182 bacterium]